MEKKGFVSYCWEDNDKVNELDNFFKNNYQLILIRDKRDLHYKNNLDDFMNKIKDYDFFILCLSDNYFKSFNCLKELNYALRDSNFNKKMLPLCFDLKIYEPNYEQNILKYWKIKEVEEQKNCESFERWETKSSNEKIKEIKKIILEISDIIEKFKKILLLNFEEEKNNNFKNLIKEMRLSNYLENPPYNKYKITFKSKGVRIGNDSDSWSSSKSSEDFDIPRKINKINISQGSYDYFLMIYNILQNVKFSYIKNNLNYLKNELTLGNRIVSISTFKIKLGELYIYMKKNKYIITKYISEDNYNSVLFIIKHCF